MAEIKINFNDALIQFTATGGETSFVYDFPIFDEDHLVVLRQDDAAADPDTMVITTGYTVTGVGAEAGGTIVLVTPASATADEIYTLFRDVPEERVTDFTQAGAFNAATVNRELDLVAMIEQQLRRDIDRSARMGEFDQGAASGMILPEKTTRASNFAAWDAAGDFIAAAGGVSGVVISAFMATVNDDITAAAARATLDAQADLDVPSQAEAEAGTATTERVWTAERIKQAIDALAIDIIRKTADETVNNSTTLQDDDHLLAALAANEIVHFMAFVVHIGNTTADIKFAFTVPGGATLIWSAPNAAVTVADALRDGEVVASSGGAGAFQGSTANRAQLLVGTVQNGATPGNLQLQWAQSTATVVDTDVLTNSYLLVWRV